MIRRAALFGAVTLLALLAGSNAHAGMVKLPCATPTFTSGDLPVVRNMFGPVPVLGDQCGDEVPTTPGASYTLHPAKAADLDIHFYDANGRWTGASNAGPANHCGNLGGTVPSNASKAIVVLSPSACGPQGQHNVPFTFTQS